MKRVKIDLPDTFIIEPDAARRLQTILCNYLSDAYDDNYRVSRTGLCSYVVNTEVRLFGVGIDATRLFTHIMHELFPSSLTPFNNGLLTISYSHESGRAIMHKNKKRLAFAEDLVNYLENFK